MENSLRAGDRKVFSEYRKKAFASGKRLLKNCDKVAMVRTDSYRLWGVYAWLIEDRKSALEWWHKARSEGERLGARPQVARTYAEMARRLFEVRDETKPPSPLQPDEFVEKARAIFADLGLHQDFEELDSAIGRTKSGLSGV
jgi:hypothetical protein